MWQSGEKNVSSSNYNQMSHNVRHDIQLIKISSCKYLIITQIKSIRLSITILCFTYSTTQHLKLDVATQAVTASLYKEVIRTQSIKSGKNPLLQTVCWLPKFTPRFCNKQIRNKLIVGQCFLTYFSYLGFFQNESVT